MELLGQQDAFAIEHGFEANPFGESGQYGASWGEFRLWVQGRNICSFSKNSQAQTYTWNLIGIFEWLCKNIVYILNDDPFPVRANGSSASDLIEDSYQLSA